MEKILSLANVNIIIKALAIGLFYHGIGMAVSLSLPGKNWTYAIGLVLLAIFILLVDDGKLSELYDLKAAAAASAQNSDN